MILVAPRAFVRVLASAVLLAAALQVRAEQPALEIIARTPPNQASGALGEWGLTGTDLTFKSDLGQIWMLDGHSSPPFIRRFSLVSGELRPANANIELGLPPELSGSRVLGLAEVPHGAFRGANVVLVDPGFADGGGSRPHLGLIDDRGMPLPDVIFARVEGLPPDAQLTSIDVHPTREEIIAYDAATHAAFRIDFTFSVVGGGVPLLGFANVFGGGRWFFGPASARGAGMGIAFDGPDSFLLACAFVNRFETRFVLRYDLDSGAYLGTAFDLRAAAPPTVPRTVTFVGLDSGERDGVPIIAAHNFTDDSIYLFRRTDRLHPPPVGDLSCQLEDTGGYSLSWSIADPGAVDAVHVFENGVRIATLAAGALRYTSPLSLGGKAFVEVATEKDGTTSDLRPLCQVENTRTPRFPALRFGATTIDNIAPLAGVASTALPVSPAAFRLYLVGFASNAVVVLDHRLEFVETIQLTPPLARSGTNLAALGLALLVRDGREVLALLDPDGPLDDNNAPSARLYALSGPSRGALQTTIERIDLSLLDSRPFLFDWDAGPDNQLVAGGVLPDGQYVLVRIIYDGERMVATQSAELPQISLSSPAAPGISGAGVSVLPSGYILVAGADGFSPTYTEGLVVTPFCDDPPRCNPAAATRFVGEAQGLFATNQFLPGIGPGLGPTQLLGLETSYFAAGPELDDAIGVTYLPAGDTVLVRNPSTETGLRLTTSNLLIHGETHLAHPGFAGEELLAQDVALEGRSALRLGPFRPALLAAVERRNFVAHVVNLAAEEALLEVDILLDGNLADSVRADLPPGRYLRRRLAERIAGVVEIAITNASDQPSALRVLLGASGIRAGASGAGHFRRGDCDTDGQASLTDALTALNWLFLEGPTPSCLDACDLDDGGSVNLSDAVALLNYLFLSGVAPAAPGPEECGADAGSDDSLPACRDASCL